MGLGSFLKKAADTVTGGNLLSAGTSIIGGLLDSGSARDVGSQNADLQREFAQNGITWKVEDAKRAGIHPLYALGAQTLGASPSYVSSNSMGSALAEAGQNLSRSIHAKSTSADRLAERLAMAQIEGQELENKYKAVQLSKLDSPGLPPPLPHVGYDGSALVNPDAMKRTMSIPGKDFSEPSGVSDLGWSTTSRGGYAPSLSSDLSQRQGELEIASIPWFIRNMVKPNLPWNWNNQDSAPPKDLLPKGAKRWYWSMGEQAWMPVR